MTEPAPRHARPIDSASSSYPLSEAGVARKDRMLGELVGEMHRVHRMRRGRRFAMVIAPVLVFALAVIWWRGSAQPVAPSPGRETTAFAATSAPGSFESPAPAVQVPVAIITMIHTADNALEPYRVTTPPHATGAETIDDAELLATLANLNRRAGIVRSGGRVWLTRNVADETSNSS